MLQIKEESGDADRDFEPTILQGVDLHYRTDQSQQQYPIVFKKESEVDKSNVDANLCSGVKQEFIVMELMVVDEQKTSQAISTAAAAGSVTVHQDVCIKDKLEDTDLDIGPAAFLHKDSSHRINQNMSVFQREDTISCDGNDPVLCDGVEIDSVEDRHTDSKPRPYTCNICQKVFPTKKTYRHHETCMHASKSYKCDQCDKAFKFRWNLNKHKKSLHSIDRYKKCNVCDQYVKLRYLKEHMVNIHSDKQRLCNVCGETVKSEDHLLLHLLDVHGQQPAKSNIFTCDYCRRTFTTKRVLRSHIKYAYAKGRYKCNQCEQSYRCERYLILHKVTKHSTLINCNVCGKSLKSVSIKSHMRGLHGDELLRCIICGEQIKSRYCLKQHMNEHHVQPSAKSIIFTCDYCRKTFTTKKVLRTHVTYAHSKRHYKCNQCEKYYKCERYLIVHKANIHSALIKCNVCGKSLKPASMWCHVRRIHGDEQLQCIVCGEEIKSKYCLKQHMNKHRVQSSALATSSRICRDVTATFRSNVSEQRLRSELYSCDKCVQTFTSKDTFRQHHTLSHSTEAHKHNECNVNMNMNIELKLEFYYHKRTSHDGKLLYECAVCKKICKSKESVSCHVTRCHRPRPTGVEPNVYVCDYCQKMFDTKTKIIDHITSVHAIASAASKCNQCGKVFRCKQYLQQHMTRHTPVIIKCNVCDKLMKLSYLKKHIRTVHSEKKFQCKICSEIVKSNQRLHDHMNDIHGEQSVASPFRCDLCQKGFASKNGLNTHIKNMLGKNHFGCSLCKCAFKSKAVLQRHIMNHKALPFRCDQCKKVYANKNSLTTHIKKVHGKDHRMCFRCNCSFKSKDVLRKHIKKIHKASRFRCCQCQKVYASKQSLYTHIKNVHGKDRRMCSHCNSGFKSDDVLQRHIKKKHKDSNNQSTCSDMGESGASSHPPVEEVNAEASASAQKQHVVVKKEEPVDEDLELGPVVFQHMDYNYRPYKEEPLLD